MTEPVSNQTQKETDAFFFPKSDQEQNRSDTSLTKKKKKGIWAIILVLGAIVLKFKFLLVALKFGKFASTFISMGLMIGVYSMQFGWKYAVGFVCLLAIHEMGHVVAARQAGLTVSMPIFIPFVGAFISMKQQPTTARTEAIVAAGGPVIGTLGAFACLYYGVVFDSNFFMALAYTGCLLNLFNLVPLSPLDGGRIVSAISPFMWVIGIPIMLLITIKFHNPITIILLILGAIKAFESWRSPDKSYFKVSSQTRTTFAFLYFGLIIILGSVMAWIHSLHNIN